MLNRIRKSLWDARNYLRGDYDDALPSYSQFAEDIIMLRALESMGAPPRRRIRYLDVGANHPSRLSNTMLFYHLGGSGVLVEPNPKLADLLRRKRGKRDTIVSAGVSASESGNMPFFVMDPDVLSTFSKSEADAYVASGYRLVEQLDVSVVSINAIVEEYFPRATVPPHVCSIDVEGVDIEIVQSLDWERFRPAVCCLETWDMAKKRDRAQLVDTMLAADYRVFARVGPNTIFVRNSIYPKAS